MLAALLVNAYVWGGHSGPSKDKRKRKKTEDERYREYRENLRTEIGAAYDKAQPETATAVVEAHSALDTVVAPVAFGQAELAELKMLLERQMDEDDVEALLL